MAEEEGTQEEKMRAIQAAIGGFCAAQMHHQELQDEAIASLAGEVERLGDTVHQLELALNVILGSEGWENQ